MYKTRVVVKIETHIIPNIRASQIGRFMIPVIMYVETFKPDVIGSVTS
jgi:hypothetical protein